MYRLIRSHIPTGSKDQAKEGSLRKRSQAREDVRMTVVLRQTGELVGIAVVDHLVVGEGKFVSLMALIKGANPGQKRNPYPLRKLHRPNGYSQNA
jgi:hypothetical protein